MSIRSQIGQRVLAHTPVGGNAAARTRQLIYTMITRFWPSSEPIDIATLPVCAWEDADEYIFLGTAHAIMIGGSVMQLRYGQSVSGLVAREIRDSYPNDAFIVPIRAGSSVGSEHSPELPSGTDAGGALVEGESLKVPLKPLKKAPKAKAKAAA